MSNNRRLQNLELSTIPERLIEPPEYARSLDQALLDRLVASITALKCLIQRIGVIEIENGRYRLVWGNHRLNAWRNAGLSPDIDAVLLPPGTTAAQEMAYSIQENHLRSDETFADTLARIEHHAKVTGCSYREAANANGIKPPMLAKICKVDEKLADNVKEVACRSKVGVTVLYEISKAPIEEQMVLLTSYVNGQSTRDDIARAVKPKKAMKSKLLSFRIKVDGGVVQVAFDGASDFASVIDHLNKARARIQQRQKQQIEFDKLPELVS